MSGYQQYRWRGKPIHDIRKWAADRGEGMVKYKAIRKFANPWTGTIVEEVEYGEMPQSFWDGMPLLANGVFYQEIPSEPSST